MCTTNSNGPRILGKIDLSQFVTPSRYSTCDECDKRATFGIYIRPEYGNAQLCDVCTNWEDMAANDTARSIFDSHEPDPVDYWDDDNSWSE